MLMKWKNNAKRKDLDQYFGDLWLLLEWIVQNLCPS